MSCLKKLFHLADGTQILKCIADKLLEEKYLGNQNFKLSRFYYVE